MGKWGWVGLVTALFLITLFRMVFVSAPPINEDHPFQTERTLERLTRVLGDERPHSVDTDAADDVVARLATEIEALGFEPEIVERFHCNTDWATVCANIRNVRFWVTEPGDDAVMIASHHDSVPTGPGAADDGMGVAISLELAYLFRDADLERPLLVLITDAEEIGLLGASAFVDHDPVAQQVGAVISLEARGNAGTANMFETSFPNNRDLSALSGWGRKPLSNSLATDIYRRMPNGTDVTRYLELDMDAANYAVVGSYDAYHTTRDTIANLNRRSVAHMGTSAYDAVSGFMRAPTRDAEGNSIYADLLGVAVIKLPSALSVPLLVILTAVFLIVAIRTPGQVRWRAFLWPILVIVGGVLAAWGGTALIGWIKPEQQFATGHPWALRGFQTALALLVAALLSLWLYRGDESNRFLLLALAWFSALGLFASLAVPGAAILFVPALTLAAIGVALRQWVSKAAGLVCLWIAVLVLGIITIPSSAMAETSLFIENAWPFALFTIWLFLLAVPLLIRRNVSITLTTGATAIVALVFGGLAVALPSYTEDNPQGRNLYHLVGNADETPVFVLGGADPVPESYDDVADFSMQEIDAFSGRYFASPAPDMAGNPLQASVSQNSDLTRLTVSAPGSDRIEVYLSNPIAADAVRVNGVEADGDPLRVIRCWGRSCRNVEIEIEAADLPGDLEFDVHSVQFGLGDEGTTLLSARPAWSLAKHGGDRRIRRTVVALNEAE